MITSIIISHLRRYPLMQAQDIYKLLYQVALGSEHAARDGHKAHAALLSEIATLRLGPEEPIFDKIGPLGQLARVHLRPYVALGYSIDRLFTAFMNTSREFHGTTETLQTYLQSAAPLAPDLPAFVAHMQAQGWPPVRHSAVYAQNYAPAYRIVMPELMT